VHFLQTSKGPTSDALQADRRSWRRSGLTVCMVITDIDPLTGGTQRQARLLIAQLQARGYHLIVLTRNYHRLAAHEIRDGVEYHRWPVVGRWRVLNSAIFLCGTLAWLVRNRCRYQIVHGHQAYAPATIGTLAAMITRRPVIIKVTASNEHGEAKEIRRLPLARLRLYLLRRVDRFVVLTTQMAREVATLGISSKRLTRIPNGVAIPAVAAYESGIREAARTRLRLPQGKIVIYTGRLSAEKGLDTLLHAWRYVVASPLGRDANLLLLGEGTAYRNVEPELRAVALRLAITQHVSFLGRVSNVEEYLLAADVFVLGSVSEGMSNSLLEAMAAGLAVAASDIDANADVVQEGEHALLFPPGDVAANARVLMRLLADAGLRERLGRAARARVLEEFSASSVAERYLDLYSEVLGNWRPGL
jgi:glycosyltransferase involved in cell wall biosynthesis